MLDALLLSVIMALATWFVIQRKRRLSFFKDLGIPGPPPSFLSGNLSEIIHKGALVKFKEWLDKYGDIVGFYNGVHPFLIVKDLELIKKIQIKDFNNFTSRGMMNLMDDSTNELLEVVESLRSKHHAIEFREVFQRLTADVIIRSAFGLRSNLQQKDRSNSPTESLLQEGMKSFQQFRRSWINFLAACFPEFKLLWRTIMSYSSGQIKTATDRTYDEVAPIIQLRRENGEKDRTDLLQLMLNAEIKHEVPIDVHSLTASDGFDSASQESQPVKVNDSGKKRFLTNTEILANSFAFFVAGFETTGTALAFTAYLLAKHQDVQGRLREEVLAVLKRDGSFTYDNAFGMKYMDQVISESLRYFSPVVGFTTRGCASDYVHKDITIPAGTSIVIPNQQMSHDPAFWKKPQDFDPERFSPENKGQIDPTVYQPFGQGPRNCIGMRFAQLEMKLTMAKLLAKYKLHLDERHIQVKELKLESTFNLAYPKNGIWMNVENI
ncbi:cytochrome P450 3A31-like isoform X2 [Dermacentor variabilis]|uniref:cytochrome P450 3A31-like isoform X2 n=1 Tax=Dermacentor variabilis TaxID=34621 RepID=UPI003F5C5100